MPKIKICEVKRKSISIPLGKSKDVFDKFSLNPNTSYLMDLKKAIFEVYGLKNPTMTVNNGRKTLAEQKPNHSYAISITNDEMYSFAKLFGLSKNDYFSEISHRIIHDILLTI